MIFETKREVFNLKVLLLDLNGTISVRGSLIGWVAEKVKQLQNLGWECCLISGDQRGKWENVAQSLWIPFFLANSEEEKADIAKRFDRDSVVSVGNARIDNGMFQNSRLRIGVLQQEGIHMGILQNIDLLFTDINHALDMLLEKDIFCATMK